MRECGVLNVVGNVFNFSEFASQFLEDRRRPELKKEVKIRKMYRHHNSNLQKTIYCNNS
jgi:hypothetical protein